jgi:tRNA (guanine37-N1)-methyltransferase
MTVRLDILTPFPDLVGTVITTSMLGRAFEKGIVQYQIHNLFEFADPPHYKIDDEPFGGGAGMVMKPEPIFRAYDRIRETTGDAHPRMIFPTPDGELFTQDVAAELAQISHLIFLCGHYKGIDQRVREQLVTDELSIGDFILTGGELPALMIIDAVVRLQPGVLNTLESAETDSFSPPVGGLLDGPHYTRPRNYRGMEVPEVLLSGHHEEIDRWRLQQRKTRTREKRPDLWESYLATEEQEMESNHG